jgi:uncharacterized membrane protein
VIAWAPAVAAVLAWPLAQQDAVPPARWAAGVLLAFLLPGLSLTAVLFFGRALSMVERAVLAPALSLAVLVLGGLVLNALRIRLTAQSWATLTASTTVVLAGAGYARWWLTTRHGGTPPVEVPRGGGAGHAQKASRATLVLKLASLAAIVILLAGASWLAITDAVKQQTQDTFTELSIVPEHDSNPTVGQRTVDIAVASHERGMTHYVMRVRGEQGPVLNQYTISLYPLQTWKQKVEVPVAQKVTAELFKGTDTTPYRTVFLSGLQ